MNDKHTTRSIEGRPTTRRRALAALAGLAAMGTLIGCGGGGGGDTDPPAAGPTPAPPPAAPVGSGTLVYRNSGVAGLWRFDGRGELEFDPGDHPSFNPGMAVSASGIVTSALQGDNDGFFFATFDLAGRKLAEYAVLRTLAFQTGAVVFDGSDARIAFSCDEPVSETVDDRINRSLVYDWAGKRELLSVDGHAEPLWAAATGELFMREDETNRLRIFDAALNDMGLHPDLVLPQTVGSYNVSADGRYILWEDSNRIRALDRATGTRWIAAERDISDTHSPCLSPDGSRLAILALDLTAGLGNTYVPHVLPFIPGTTVRVDSAQHALDTIAECRGRIGWTGRSA